MNEKRNPSIPWCSNCGSMMPVLGDAEETLKTGKWGNLEDLWFECFECDKPDKIPYYEGQERVRKQNNELGKNLKEEVLKNED